MLTLPHLIFKFTPGLEHIFKLIFLLLFHFVFFVTNLQTFEVGQLLVEVEVEGR